MLASGLIAGGMNWWQAVGTILLGNLIVLGPMILNAHAGTKYGIPFPVLVRSSFGVKGANLPAVLRALVACGWFGIQTWIGGQAIASMAPHHLARRAIAGSRMALLLRLLAPQYVRDLARHRKHQNPRRRGAPFMIASCSLLLFWVTSKAGGLGPVLAQPSKFQTNAAFFHFFVPSLTGMVGFWATVALNIPDFTRYAKSRERRSSGKSLGLPPAMTLFSFIGVAVTSASAVIFGDNHLDPVVLIGRFQQPVVAFIALIALLIATLEHERSRQRRLACERFREPRAAPDFVPHRRPDHRSDRHSDDAVEAHGHAGSYVYGWLVGYSGAARPRGGCDDCRLLHHSQPHPAHR